MHILKRFITMQKGATHEALQPLCWLIGKWKSTNGEGIYPTIKPFSYHDEITFESIGQPILNYSSVTWNPDKGKPMHLESGFLRIKPGTNEVAFMVAHNFGVTTLEEGCVCKNELILKSTHISRMSFGREPAVTAIERCLKIVEGGNLEIVLLMETTRTPMTQHLKALYEKM